MLKEKKMNQTCDFMKLWPFLILKKYIILDNKEKKNYGQFTPSKIAGNRKQDSYSFSHIHRKKKSLRFPSFHINNQQWTIPNSNVCCLM